VPATIWSARSTDDGRTWGHTRKVTLTDAVASSTLPGTTLHRSIVQYLAVSPDRPGHLYVAWNRIRHGQTDVMLSSSRDGGDSWSRPRRVNDDRGRQHQFSATVAAGPHGAVVVGFYDMRARCPSDAAILPDHRGDAGTCLGLTLQPFREQRRGLHPTRGNVLVSRHLWDPYQPGGTRNGVSQLPCEDPMPQCDDIFLGDYFSMQISKSRVSVLSASTLPRSGLSHARTAGRQDLPEWHERRSAALPSTSNDDPDSKRSAAERGAAFPRDRGRACHRPRPRARQPSPTAGYPISRYRPRRSALRPMTVSSCCW
jgi:hypothetical protein